MLCFNHVTKLKFIMVGGAMKSKGRCENCKKEPFTLLGADMKSIGESVVIENPVGRGYDQTTHNFCQCTICGSIWVKYVDRGAGGRGNFLRCLTSALF
jgi:hypothetical protein